MLRHAKKHVPFIEEYSPELFEMIQGIAEATERPHEEIVLINMDEEKGMFKDMGCTAFAVTGRASKTGEVFHGQTDMGCRMVFCRCYIDE